MKPIDVYLKALGISDASALHGLTPEAMHCIRDFLQSFSVKANCISGSGSIEKLECVSVGGVDQWVHIRSKNIKNPIMLFVHGGPGASMIGWSEDITRPWEDYFTIVNWDQRQAGKSYRQLDDSCPSLDIETMVKDCHEVIQHLLSSLGKDKLFIFSHSWGSVIGTYIAKFYPHLLYAYIGVGQVVNTIKSEEIIFQRLYEKSLMIGNKELQTSLERISPYPDPDDRERCFVKHCMFLREELSNVSREAGVRGLSLIEFNFLVLFKKFSSPHIDVVDFNRLIGPVVPDVFKPPYDFTRQYLDINLPDQIGRDLSVPVFMLCGRHDWQTPSVLCEQWFEKINAPYKELIFFEQSSHYPFIDEPGKFFYTLVDKILPCTGRSSVV